MSFFVRFAFAIVRTWLQAPLFVLNLPHHAESADANLPSVEAVGFWVYLQVRTTLSVLAAAGLVSKTHPSRMLGPSLASTQRFISVHTHAYTHTRGIKARLAY